MIKRQNTKSKGVFEVLRSLNKPQFIKSKEIPNKEALMKAKCKRYAGRNILVGKTSFTFDDEGICVLNHIGYGNAPKDFQLLLSMNGVSEYKEAEVKVQEELLQAPPMEAAPVEAVGFAQNMPKSEIIEIDMVATDEINDIIKADSKEKKEEKPKKKPRRKLFSKKSKKSEGDK